MWNDGQYLLFLHIADFFHQDQQYALHLLPKLTLDHILLTGYSKMKVHISNYHIFAQNLLKFITTTEKKTVVALCKE